jgi:hypothetical protein
MSLLFRSRPPRKFRRKPAGKVLRKPPVSKIDLWSGLFPGPRAVPAPVPHASRRRSQRATGYAMNRPRQPMFRVT